MVPIDYSTSSTLILTILLLIGLGLLFFGGEWLCRGASALAIRLNVSPVIIGLTIVAVATSMPEMMTSFYSAFHGNYGIAVGNIVGSNLANMGLILGIAALVCPIVIHSRLVRTEVPLLMGITVIFGIMSWNGTISQLEGIILLILTVAYLYFTVKSVKKEHKKVTEEITEEIDKQRHTLLYCIIFIILGGIGLQFGAEFLLHSSVEFATRMGISEVLIGLTIVAIGTSLPELSASLVAAFRGHSDICAGNVVGSNLFNIMLIGGGVSVFYPLEVEHSLFRVEYPAMLLITALVWWLFASERRVTRKEGALLVGLYCISVGLSIVSQLKWG